MRADTGLNIVAQCSEKLEKAIYYRNAPAILAVATSLASLPKKY
jgi:hypothetical protein